MLAEMGFGLSMSIIGITSVFASMILIIIVIVLLKRIFIKKLSAEESETGSSREEKPGTGHSQG